MKASYNPLDERSWDPWDCFVAVVMERKGQIWAIVWNKLSELPEQLEIEIERIARCIHDNTLGCTEVRLAANVSSSC